MSRQKTEFDALYSRAKGYYGGASDGLRACLSAYAVHKGRALDLGCGQGRNALWLAQQGFAVDALDISEQAIADVRAAASAIHVSLTAVVQDISDLALSPSSYDLIVAITTLNHVSASRLPSIAATIVSGMMRGALLYIVAFTTADPGYGTPSKDASECADLVEHHFTHNELLSLFSPLDVVEYLEYEKEDTSHGAPHMHGKAKLIARRAG